MDGSLGSLSDPLVLSATGSVSPNGGASLNTGALANPHELPMVIHELRFRLSPQTDTANAFVQETGQAIAIKLDLGDIQIIDAGTPVSLLGGFRESSEDAAPVYATTDPAILASPVTYWWRPKYPIYVPPGQILTPAFEHLGQINYATNLDVMYVGRTLAKNTKPSGAMYPWVSAYNFKSQQQVSGATAFSDTSSELKLNNPFDIEMEIAKLTGRLAMINSTNGGAITNYAIEEEFDQRSRLMTLRIRSSKGEDVLRTPLTVDTLFPYGWRVWELGRGAWKMKPGEFYKAQLNVAAMDFDPVSTRQGQAQFSLGLVGYRKVKLGKSIKGAA